MKKNGNQYWYDYVDINLLLKNNSNNSQDYKVIDATSQDDLNLVQTINSAVSVFEVDSSCNVVVIPINLGDNNDEGIYEGSHWVGLVIRRNNDKLEAFYSDSFGIPINNTLSDLTQILENHEIKVSDLSGKQQSNNYDCGPWVVFNLDSIARTGKLAKDIKNNDILQQRNKLTELSQSFERVLITQSSDEEKEIYIENKVQDTKKQDKHNLYKEGKEKILIINDKEIELLEKTFSEVKLEKGKSNNNLKFLINTIAYVPSDNTHSSDSSDGEDYSLDKKLFNEIDLKDKDTFPYKTFKKITKAKNIKTKEVKLTESEELGSLNNVQDENVIINKSSKLSRVAEPLLQKLEQNAFDLNEKDKLQTIKVSIGFNRPKSLSNRLNKILTDELECKSSSKINHEKFGFFWHYNWYDKKGKSVDYTIVQKFYRQFKTIDKKKAQEFRKINEKTAGLKIIESTDKAIKQKGTLIPYQELREYVKNHNKTQELVKAFKDQDKEKNDIIYFSFIDADTISFNGIYSAYLRIHNKYFKENNVSPTVMSTGYEFDGKGKNYPFKIGSQIDREIRIATAKHIPLGVYYPEPNFCVLLPPSTLTLPESFIDKKIKPKGTSESVALLRKVKLRENAIFTFSEDKPVITDIPLRAKYTKKTKDKIKFSEDFTKGGLPTKEDVKGLRQMSQSHFFEGIWLDNLYINKGIVIYSNYYKFKGLITTFLKNIENFDELIKEHCKPNTLSKIINARLEVNKVIKNFKEFSEIVDINEIITLYKGSEELDKSENISLFLEDYELNNKIIEFIEENHDGDYKDEIEEEHFTLEDALDFSITTESHDERQADFTTPILSALIQKGELSTVYDLINSIEKFFVNKMEKFIEFLNEEDSGGKTALFYALIIDNEILISKLKNLGATTKYIPKRDNMYDDLITVKKVGEDSDTELSGISSVNTDSENE